MLGPTLAQEGGGDDWDWGAFEQMDDAPVTKKSSAADTGGPPASEPAALARSAENALPDFTAPPRQAYPVVAGMPPFEVIPSQRDADMHPCSNCHQWVTSNPQPRKLKPPHDNFELAHGQYGKGEFWCLTCHDLKNGTGLKTLEGEPVEFADAYIVCGQCHSRQTEDWARGAHGKRVGAWRGTRQVLSCTACHYQHRPAIAAREPMPGPAIRVGLERPAHWSPDVQREPPADAAHQAPWRRASRAPHGPAAPRDTPDTGATRRDETS